jgi:hypothetical protein
LFSLAARFPQDAEPFSQTLRNAIFQPIKSRNNISIVILSFSVRCRIVSYQRDTSRQQQEKDGTMNYQIKNHASDALPLR